jgi:predicted phage tail protein
MNKVHLMGDIGDKFGYEWSMNVSDYGEIIRLIDCQREGFKQYLIESEENEIGFVIQRAGEYINDEQELLLNLNDEDIIITAVPLGAGTDSGKGGFMGSGLGKIIIGVILIIVGYYLGPEAAAKLAAWISKAMIIVGTTLVLEGVQQLMLGDIDKTIQEEGYLFDGGNNNILQGQPVPLLYGELLIAGTPISASMSNNAIPLSYLEYTDRDYTNSNSLYATNYKNAQNAGNAQAGTSGGTVVDAHDDYYVEER